MQYRVPTALAVLGLAGCVASTPPATPEREAACRPTHHDRLGDIDVPEGEPPVYDEERAAVAPWPAPSSTDEAGLAEALDQAESMDVDAFLASHAVPRVTTLPYDPLDAANLDRVQTSELFLDSDERSVLSENGFVISERQQYASFLQGYEAVYTADLPVFISLDSVMYAMHRSFDRILQWSEWSALRPELSTLLDELREAAAAEHAELGSSPTLAQLDTYLTTARRLLQTEREEPVMPVAGGDEDRVEEWTAAALEAEGLLGTEVFGEPRSIDFSQMKPRGHYTSSRLREYFRAMMWLGRVDIRVVEVGAISLELSRPQLAAALVLDRLLSRIGTSRWERIDGIIGAFMGGRETMLPGEIADALSEIGVEHESDLGLVDDETLLAKLLEVGASRRRVASTVLLHGPLEEEPTTQPVGVALFGQRFSVDAQVMGNVVYDRVDHERMRLMPSPLDVAFAALGNDDAARLLEPELRAYGYASHLEAERLAVDAHDAEFWQSDLYHRWMSVLRAVSPRESAPEDLPAVARTEAWSRRVLNTQLASWAELRHDTVLYSAQSYSGGGTCDYPEAYVEPAPEAFRRMAVLAAGFEDLATALQPAAPRLADKVKAWASATEQTARLLSDMAERQRTGLPLTEAQLDFVNHAVRTIRGCAGIDAARGWYADLFISNPDSYDDVPIVADVHTQPFDETGGVVGRVLHVGTGHPRLMAVTFETCEGPRLYLGFVSSYYEMITSGFDRLDDSRHEARVWAAPPADVPWMRDLVVRWPDCPAR